MGGVVKRCAATVFTFVSNVVNTTVNVVRTVARKVQSVVSAVNNVVTKGINFVSQKCERLKDWFIRDTAIGRGIGKACNYVMNQTFIGKGIKYVGSAINETKRWFFEDTFIGRGLSKAKDWFDQTAVGKFVNKFQPLIQIGAYALGGFGGFIGKTINFVSNPSSILTTPFGLGLTNKFTRIVDKGKTLVNKITQSPIVRTISTGYQKVKDISASIKDKIFNNPIVNSIKSTKNLITEKGSALFEKIDQHPLMKPIKSTFNKVKDYASEYSPQIVYHTSSGFKKTAQIGYSLLSKVSQKCQPLSNTLNSLKNASVYKKSANILNNVNKYGISPIKWIVNKTVTPVGKYIWNKTKDYIQSSKVYKAVESPLVKLADLKRLGQVRCSSEYKNLIKKEQQFENLSSQVLLTNYIRKYKNKEEPLKQVSHRFKIVEDQEKILHSFVKKSQVKIEHINFNYLGQNSNDKAPTIGGKIKLKNLTNEAINFKIPSGQMFNSSKDRSAQHTVVKEFNGDLQPNEQKQFVLQAFCGDSSLSWPRNDNKYALSSMKLGFFDEDMDQSTVWKLTS